MASRICQLVFPFNLLLLLEVYVKLPEVCIITLFCLKNIFILKHLEELKILFTINVYLMFCFDVMKIL